MDEIEITKVTVPIRSAFYPAYYRDFRCLAGACRDDCCSDGWNITFSKKDYLRLRRLDASPELREKLERCVRREKKDNHGGAFYARFDLSHSHGRCPLQNGEGLCSLQLACGPEALPFVCRSYPRKDYYTTAAREYALSPSCEGVLQQLWDLPDGVEFVEDPLPKEERREATIPQDGNLLLYFAPLRGLFIDILQDRSMPLTERMLYLGVVIQRLQKEEWTLGFDPDGWAERMLSPGSAGAVRELAAGTPGNRAMYLTQNVNVLSEIALEERKVWTGEVARALEVRREMSLSMQSGTAEREVMTKTDFSNKAYTEALERFRAAFGDREYFFENLMVASVLFFGFPKLDSKEELWKSYVSLCNLYSFYRFVSVLGCKEEATKERLFHMIAMASRSTLHSRDRLNGFQESLFRHDSSTLAHMAILLRWD